eukprot:9557423-Ditylum_brightwellii.AAC.1
MEGTFNNQIPDDDRCDTAISSVLIPATITGARIKCDFKKVYNVMLQKNLRKKQLSRVNDKLILFDSYDGAKHRKSDFNRVYLVSFLLTLFSSRMLSDGTSTSSTKSILA